MSNPYGQSPTADEPQPSSSPTPDYQQPPYEQPQEQQPQYQQPPAGENPYQQYAPVSYPQPAYGQPAPYGQQYGGGGPEHPQGTIVLILGILGFFVGVTAPFAWYLGSKAMKEIRASGIPYSNEAQVNIGRILGIVMTLLYALSIVAVIIFFVVIVGITANS